MSDITITIDGKQVKAKQGATILEAAQSIGISIPTLCYHQQLEPYGACRICMVEVEARGRTTMVASCIYTVEPGLMVRTRSEKIDKVRKMTLQLLLAHAPDAEILKDLAKEYGADTDRFEKEPSFCIHCGLCVRYCAEIKKLNAVGFIDRGTKREISFVPDIALKECWNCKECFPLCPTEALQAAYVFMKLLTTELPSPISE